MSKRHPDALLAKTMLDRVDSTCGICMFLFDLTGIFFSFQAERLHLSGQVKQGDMVRLNAFARVAEVGDC